MPRVTELAFVMAQRQNHFFVELVEAIRSELEALGVPSRVVTEGFPPPRRGLVYVLVPPHEYFALLGTIDPSRDAPLQRTLFICAEQPSSYFFERNVELAKEAGAVFDISCHAVREWNRRGVRAAQFELGYTSTWDRSPFVGGRDIDVAFLGSRSERRARVLASHAPSLWRWRSRLVLSDNSRPNYSSNADFLIGQEKHDLLERVRVLLNIHTGEEQYCETLRIVEAIHCGAVVVSEHSEDVAPLVSGSDFVTASPENLMLMATEMLEDENRRRAFASTALERLRDQVPLRAAVELLAEQAESLDRRAPCGSAAATVVSDGSGAAAPDFEFLQPDPRTTDPDQSELRRVLKQIRLDLLAQRRRVDRLADSLSMSRPVDVSIERSTSAYAAAQPRVSVIVSLYNYENQVEAALDSAAASELRALELIVVDDASTDASLERVLKWCERNPSTPTLVVGHRLNQGLPHARNTAVDFARGDLAFILDADNQVYPHALSRLVEELDQHPEAVFAWGMADRFDSDGPIDLLSVGGWEPMRLRHSNYIDAMAMIRVKTLRQLDGYTTDVRLYGWEDYDLWCKVAERGWEGFSVREILGRYRVSAGSMLRSTTNLSMTEAYVALIERHPQLMAGIRPPL